MNLCFDALDRQVIVGRADVPAVVDGSATWTVARLLEEVGAIGGAMRGLGVEPGSVVGIDVADPRTRLVAGLAALRLGAVPVLDGPAEAPALLLVDEAPAAGATTAPAVLVTGEAPTVVETRDLSLPAALRAGRTDPAPVSEPLPGRPAYVVGEREVHEPETGTFLGAALADLGAGRLVDLR
ncbi:AMP-binding protein [uncultured Nocardioides sp.]|uniref:AMP-binding protein n=1 Tax=uncultured Nocardioides sp. TaxID=198441 RepID=UPI00260D247B|nr:AMP-binding protein [uncultured Nocardioides sp.]